MARLFKRKENRAVLMPLGASSSISKKAGVQQSISKQRQPLDYLRSKGIVEDEAGPEWQKRIRELCRAYYKYTDLIPMIITIYATFPLQGMRISCKTSEQQRLFDKQFMDPDGLDYRMYLPEVGKEFFKVGEVNSFAIFDYATKWWQSEEILNPDDIEVEDSIFADQDTVSLEVSRSLKEILEQNGSADAEYIKEAYPDLADAISSNRRVILKDDFIFRIVEKDNPWDNRGTPIMLRAFEALLQMEGLNAAQDAIADRLYSPLILAKLGIPAGEMGKDQQPWIPTQSQLEAFSAEFDKALAADFRMIAHHFGIDIRSVFGRESMPNLGPDFDRLERRILRAFGIGPSLIDGSSQGAYASSAINRDFVSQLMASYQQQIKALFKKRAKVFSEQRGIFETTVGDDGIEVPLMEPIATVNENDEVVIEQRPVIYVPELVFSSNPLRDASFEMNLLMTMRQAGIPISDNTVMEASTLDITLDDELDKLTNEDVEKKISQIAMTSKLEEKLKELNIDTSASGMKEQEELSDRLAPEEEEEQGDAGRVEQETNTYKPSKELS